MKLYRAGAIAGLIACAVVLAACSSSKKNDTKTTGSSTAGSSSSAPAGGAAPTCSTGTLNAEGSTAQTNAINAWITAYDKACSGATINYNPTGSGAGVTAFNAKQVDFAGSDSALDPTKGEIAAAQKRCGSTPLDLPMVVGPIAIAYKLKGVDKVTLNGEVLAKIFLGKVKTWNDPAIKALNSGANLPSTKISVFYRSDSSGTTQNFERYLAATAPSLFTSKPDKDSSKAGFAGQGKAKSQGVAAAIASTEGAIGYDEFSFAVSSGLSTASIDNGGGRGGTEQDHGQRRGRGRPGGRHRQRPQSEAGLRHQDAGCLPDHPGDLRDRLLQVQRRRQGDVRQELPQLHGGRRTGSTSGLGLRPAAERAADQGQSVDRDRQLST